MLHACDSMHAACFHMPADHHRRSSRSRARANKSWAQPLKPHAPLLPADTLFAADLTIMEEGTELIHRITHHLEAHPTGGDEPMPMFTSCCPGWVGESSPAARACAARCTAAASMLPSCSTAAQQQQSECGMLPRLRAWPARGAVLHVRWAIVLTGAAPASLKDIIKHDGSSAVSMLSASAYATAWMPPGLLCSNTRCSSSHVGRIDPHAYDPCTQCLCHTWGCSAKTLVVPLRVFLLACPCATQP